MHDVNPNPSRRHFLKSTAAMSLAAMSPSWAANLAQMAAASAADASDYKALVCVFLNGGNDNANTVVPYDPDSYARYQKARPAFAYARERLAPTVLTPCCAPMDAAGFGHEYALAPELAPLLPLFDAGKLALILNLGTLVEPTTKLQYTNKSVRLPARLFSHNDQRAIWQSSHPEGAAAGWGGMFGDACRAGNANPAFSCINLSDNAVFLSGRTSVQYQVLTGGPVPLAALDAPLFGSPACSAALRALISEPRPHLLEEEYSRIMRRSIDSNEQLAAVLAAQPPLATYFTGSNSLADQLKMVARLMSVAPALGLKRQIFMVTLNGFDNHGTMLADHPRLLTRLGLAMAAFYSATAELGIADQVTTFTASEFGRALSCNSSGSDHGWGSTHFVLGGAVKGKLYYGTAPIIADGGPDDVGQGRLLPTTSVEQLAATLGAWLGIGPADLLTALPNLANYNLAARNLGFV